MGKHVGSFIKQLREKKGLSQADVARLLSLKTAQSISNIERGVSPLPRAKIKKLADILGIRKGEIVNVVMREMQERVSKAAGVQARSIVLGPEHSQEDFSLLSSLADRFREAKTNERSQLKKAVRKLLD
ncbi:MAG: helix-turn-helix transcriptional regulator [Deltaproteobacteria bacterium]|nr:helix-turn-helix transcriptional regulator [Deltaproteobacteria bacterium]